VVELHANQRGLVQEKVEPDGELFNLSAADIHLPRFFFSCQPQPARGGEAGPMEIRIELPGVKLGVVEADGVRVSLEEEALALLMTEVCERKRGEFTVESLAEAQHVRAVRAMFRGWDIDPSKYRPSSEALLRRVVQGKGLYHVSNVVDIGNLGSIETGWPYGCYDRGKIKPPIVLRHGAAGERYEGIGKRTWHLEGRPVLADPDGPFGSPISDSTRTMITEAAQDVLIVVYAPVSADDASLTSATDRLTQRLSQFAAARETRTKICA
jgi:DNA/RNA-binding domain of Phe-tRNA-synthetase-like protein